MKEIKSFLDKLLSIYRREGSHGLLIRAANRLKIKMPIYVRPRSVVKLYENMILNANGKTSDEFVPVTKKGFPSTDLPVKLIAFYLPQFHPIPENDKWWGRGFTEWTNVSKAVPQFAGHYQPHLPGELGYYDLRLPDVQARQIELAHKYGIHGFAFHYYWFNGKRLLEKPLNMFLESENEFPFCLCWANENWTRRWDGQENDILISQAHTPESDLQFIEDLAPFFKDKRYIRIDGRPLLIVYRANILPDILSTVKLWREYCKTNGLGDPYLVAAQTFWFTDPREVGFDAAVEFPPHNIPVTNIRHLIDVTNKNYQGTIIDYKEVIDHLTSKALPSYHLFRTVFPGWDNEARKPGRGYTFAFSSPSLYKDWLTRTVKHTLSNEDNPEMRLVFINAWNEWAEGAHLEPDRKYGYAYLQSTREVMDELVEAGSISRLPIIIFQPGKVGSTSIHVSLKKKYEEIGVSVPVHHAHVLENIDERIEFVSKVRANPANTIKKLLESKELKDQIDRQPEKAWNVISLVRDPVAQKVSALFQLIDEYVPDWQLRFKNNSLSLLDLQKILLEREEFEVGRLDAWFDNQLKPLWHFDVFSIPFRKEEGFQIYKPSLHINLMMMRLEDLNRVAERAFHEFINVNNFSITSSNTNEEKPYYKLYKQFKRLPIPVAYLDEAYNTRYARHFYTDKEISEFRNRWLSPQLNNKE